MHSRACGYLRYALGYAFAAALAIFIRRFCRVKPARTWLYPSQMPDSAFDNCNGLNGSGDASRAAARPPNIQPRISAYPLVMKQRTHQVT